MEMAALRFALAGCLLLALAGAGRAQAGKVDQAKLVGIWTFVKTTSKAAPPPGATMKVTFTKDGKITVAMAANDKTMKMEGTYTLKGDQLTTVMKGPGGKETKETVTVQELTDKRFVTAEKEGGKTVTTEFKK
jgi:uncharacterized protein (TIGR03066 family)